jgi:hypothetical protein
MPEGGELAAILQIECGGYKDLQRQDAKPRELGHREGMELAAKHFGGMNFLQFLFRSR